MHNVLKDATAQLWAIAFSYFRKADVGDAGAQWTTDYDPACTFTGTDDERIAALLKTRSMAARFSPNKVTFADLWNRNVEKLSATWPAAPGNKSGLPYDGSSADQALFNHLGYGFGNNCEAMERVATRGDCLLHREKWDNRPDYLRATILKAVAVPKRWTRRNAPVSAPASTAYTTVPLAAALETRPQLAATVAEQIAPGIPAPPAEMPTMEDQALALGSVGSSHMPVLFEGYVYINDMDRIVSPDGFVMNKLKFDNHPRFAKRQYIMTAAGDKMSDSAWEGFTQSQISTGRKVRAAIFDPRLAPGAVTVRDEQECVNTYRPLNIESTPGDVQPFLTHLTMLFEDWPVLLDYLKFMVQRKGEKAMWWPFLYGMPGNGKSYITETMQYCIGEKFTQRPQAGKLDGDFNASLYGCLFLGVDDIKVAEDYQRMWETLKPMVTQTRLEIEPKGIDKVTREVCFNAILNSNHKTGIRKEPDDRRIAPFFSKQQRVGDLERDGLTEAYFDALWAWSENGGWAHVLHYLATDPISAAFSSRKCPITSSTEEHIRVSRGPQEQEVLEVIRCNVAGFKGGWVNFVKVNNLLDGKRYKATPATRHAMMENLGYVPHPGLPGGQIQTPLPDTSMPVLYVLPTHTTISLTDANQIKAMYEAANKV